MHHVGSLYEVRLIVAILLNQNPLAVDKAAHLVTAMA